MPGKCPHCGGEATLESIRAANGRCPSCGQHVKVRFTGAPRPVVRPAPSKPPGEGLRSSLESIGPYEILSEISRGGMGIVYKARDKNLKKNVAIKVLLRGAESSSEELKRFRREAEATAKLQHSNIVPIHAVGVCQGLHYFVMDFIEGESLSDMVERGGASPRASLEYVEQLADALAYAHAAGVIHRDIKPANVMIDRFDRPQLMDFGLAKEVGSETQLTQIGTTMGTPTYMPPEQAEGDLAGIDAQSDVYSLGAVLYELLTGKPPFEGQTTMAILMKVLEEEPPRPRTLNPRIHPDVEAICLKAMAKDKRDRYRSAAEFRDDIRRFKAGEMIEAARGSTWRRTMRALRRHAQLVVAVLVLAIGAGGWAVWKTRNDRQDRMLREQTMRTQVAALLESASQAVTAGSRDDLTRAESLYKQVQGLVPGDATAADGLERIAELRRQQEIARLMARAQAYLDKRNYEVAQVMFEEALRNIRPSEPAAAEANAGLRKAQGTGTLSIGSKPAGATVYVADEKDFAEPEPTPGTAPGRRLGTTPFTKLDIAMGLHRVTIVKDGFGWQSIPVFVARGQDVKIDEEIELFPVSVAGGSLRGASNLVRVPGGTVRMDDGSSTAVKSFLIDRYEYPNRLGVVPRKCVSFADAEDLTSKNGKRLPTRAEWMLAAGGEKNQAFPYGDSFKAENAATGRAFEEGPLACGLRFRDRSSCGVYDMSGNVSEWIADESVRRHPLEGDDEAVHDACGGNWTSIQPESASTHWSVSYAASEQPEVVGFRGVLSPPAGPAKSDPGTKPKPGPGPAETADVFVKECPPGMIVIRPRPGTAAAALVPYAFCIDKYEYPSEEGKAPKAGVSWDEANRIARSLGKRLPTANEWRVAAGGEALSRYGYGDEYKPGSFRIGLTREDGPARSGETPGAKSPYGIFDLQGNLMEWLNDKVPDAPGMRWVAGGCWFTEQSETTSSSRVQASPDTAAPAYGFRCVVRLEEKN